MPVKDEDLVCCREFLGKCVSEIGLQPNTENSTLRIAHQACHAGYKVVSLFKIVMSGSPGSEFQSYFSNVSLADNETKDILQAVKTSISISPIISSTYYGNKC